ncbi:hypothetical protein LEP1GSC188_2022 [Leptospira weilii serovar Topaz str. LT2116]|uniref:Uncharacterized protein n=1 Tax=Leptospira weilii serovar Topaz str. LT2116 TaxID=1088540 RepID=M3EQK8_9LEPT|nr:hypothetical protein LEP1GSC188_2022 [Leptospira weilii serovar Topaz str. LT2116]
MIIDRTEFDFFSGLWEIDLKIPIDRAKYMYSRLLMRHELALKFYKKILPKVRTRNFVE